MSDCHQLEETSAPWVVVSQPYLPGRAGGPSLQGEEILDRLRAEPDEAVLNLGGGGQEILAAAGDRGLKVTGMEFTPEAAIFCQKALPGSEIVVGRLPGIPFCAESFHLVTCLTPPAMSEPLESLGREIFRVLKPGGRACLVLPNAYYRGGRPVQDAAAGNGLPAQAREEWERRLWTCGLDPLMVRPEGSLADLGPRADRASMGREVRRWLWRLAPAICVPRFAFFCRKH